MTIERHEYPRPDFIRQDWVCLNGQWDFSFDEAVYDRQITVPFCYQSKASGIGIEEDHETVCYRRSFAVDAEKLSGRRLLLKFGAVDSRADVWVNGVYQGCHVGGYTPFAFDITDVVKPGENVLEVKATDPCNTDKPRGKQSWTGECFGCWYTPCSGIWQSVWLEYAGSVYLQKVKLTPNVNELQALCELFVSTNLPVKAEVVASLRGEELYRHSFTCSQGYGKTVISFADLDINRWHIFWSQNDPNLIDVDIRLLGQSGAADEVSAYFGMRNINVCNGWIAINGDKIYQRLILDQGYWPESLLTPPSNEAIKLDLQLTRDMGFNGARKHQKLEDPRYYYWADKMGMLVWGEMPSAYQFNDNAIHATAATAMEFIDRDYNHPSIITWVPVNESWGVRGVLTNKQQQDYCRMLVYLFKALDPTRLVSGNDGWEQISETDICAVHDYVMVPGTVNKYDNMEQLLKTGVSSRLLYAYGNSHQGQPIIMTEYGGIAFESEKREGSWGYLGRVKDNAEFLGRLAPVTEYLIESGKFAGFCYTQLTDVMQEVNGLLTEDRRCKLSPEVLRKVFGK